MTSTDVLPPGTVLLDKYRIGRPLGSGGMSVVYEATHLQLGQRVAQVRGVNGALPCGHPDERHHFILAGKAPRCVT